MVREIFPSHFLVLLASWAFLTVSCSKKEDPENAAGSERQGLEVAQHPDVVAVIEKMNVWLENQPEGKVLIKSLGPDQESVAEVFYARDPDGSTQWKIRSQIIAPIQSLFVLEEKEDTLLAYFPHSLRYVRYDKTKNMLENLGLPTEDIDVEQVLGACVKASVEDRPDGGHDLHLVLATDLLKLPGPSMEIDATLTTQGDGRLSSIIHSFMGMQTVSSITFEELGKEEVIQAMPFTPELANLDAETSFADALSVDARRLDRNPKPPTID